AELGAELGPAGLAEVAAPMLAPHPCDLDLAREHVTEQADPLRRRELDAVPGAIDALAAGVVDAVAQGLGGLTRELELQVAEPDVDWGAVSAPVRLVYGERDTTAPQAFGRWWADHLPAAATALEVVPGAGHLVALARWPELLAHLAGQVGPA
ncbi:MAG: hypothetical protein KDA97_15060, partial [Acidimicrobiales bacterium]|nr:hypothetical protein [Acidimicrobiales bacterium]